MVKPRALTKADYLQIANDIEEAFRRYGVQIRALSDIQMLITEVRWLANHINGLSGLSENDLKRGQDAFRRAEQAGNVAFTFKRLGNTQIPREKIEALKDRLDCLNERGNSRAPDIFFELEVAGRLARPWCADWNVSFEEPDIVVRCPAGEVAFACKRPKSANRIPQRIVEATKQGIKTKLMTFVMVGMDDILMGSRLWRAKRENDLRRTARNLLRDSSTTRKCEEAIQLAFSKGAAGVVFCLWYVALVPGANGLALRWGPMHRRIANRAIPDAEKTLDVLVRLMEQ